MSGESEDLAAGRPPAPGSGQPEPAPVSESESLELEWRRLHPLSPLLRGGLFLIVIAGIVIANLRDRILELFVSREVLDVMGPNESDLIDFIVEQSLLVWVLLALLVTILLIVGFSWLSWRFSTFRITREAVESRRGVLFRQHRRAPLERIQSVNLQRSLLARVLGLTQVDVQTAGQGGKVDLQYLGHRDAKQVREQILLAVGATRAAGDAATRQSSSPANGDVLLERTERAHGAGVVPAVDFSGHAYGEMPGAMDARLRDAVDFDIDPSAGESGSLIKVPVTRLIASILLGSEMLTVVLIGIAVMVSSIWFGPVALATALPLAIVLVSILISQFNKGFNFVLSRASDGVRVGAGLTATTTETIPFGRVHAVEAIQPIGWRPLGWWKVRITTAGHSAAQAGQNKLQNTVLPVGELDDVLKVCEVLLHDGEDGFEDRRSAMQDALTGEGRGFLKAGPGAGWVLWFGRGRAGIRVDDVAGKQASLRIRRGWLTRSLSVMPMLRAQSVQLSRPLMHRMLGLATLQAHTVLGPVRMQMRGVALEDARHAFDVLAATVVRVQRNEAVQYGHRAEPASHGHHAASSAPIAAEAPIRPESPSAAEVPAARTPREVGPEEA